MKRDRQDPTAVTEAVDAVVTRIEADRDYVIELARELVRIPSVNPRFETGAGLNREPDVQRVVATELERAGLSTVTYDVFPGRPNVYAFREGTEERSLIVNGHVDVVPAGDPSTWSVDPFGAELQDGKLYGRGSQDMKSGIAAATAAVKALHDCGIELEGRLELHSVVDEEAGGFGSIDLVQRGRVASALISAEPTDGKIITVEGGLEWVRVTIRGRSGHAGSRYNDVYPQRAASDQPEPAVNAAELAARFITAVGELERDWGRRKAAPPLLPPGINTINPGVVHVGAGLGADGLPTTMSNPAITPDVAVIDFDLKYLPAEESRQVREEFERFVHHWSMQDSWLREHPPSVQWELGGLHFPPFDTPSDHPLVEAVTRQHAALGNEAELAGYVAVCDAAFYAGAGASPVVYGARGHGAHGPDEWVDVASVVTAAKVYAAAAASYCGVK